MSKEKDEQKRAVILNDLAWKENLPGLYDPISGYFIRKQSPNPESNQVSIAATAREADTQALAKLGLVPGTAKTSALGGLIGTGKNSWLGLDKEQDAANNMASSAVKQQSANVQGKQSSDAFVAPKLKRLTDLVAKISGGTMESFSFNGELARRLVESFSYQLYEKVTIGTGPVVQKDIGNGMTISTGQYQSEVAEIKSLMAELADIDDPAVIQALGSAQKALDKLAGPGSTNQPNIMKPAPVNGDKKTAGPSGTQVQTDDNGKPLPNGGRETPSKTAGGEKGSKPVGPTATTQEKMDRFVYLMNKKKASGASTSSSATSTPASSSSSSTPAAPAPPTSTPAKAPADTKTSSAPATTSSGIPVTNW